MTYIKPEIMKKIKQVDLLTYLLNYQPERLKKISLIHIVLEIMTAFTFQMAYGIGSQWESVEELL